MILTTCATIDDNKFYPKLFLEGSLLEAQKLVAFLTSFSSLNQK